MAYSNYVTITASTLAGETPQPAPAWRIGLSWDAVEGGISYKLQVSAGGTDWDEIYLGAETSFLYNALLENIRYEFRVAASNGFAWSPWTTTSVTLPPNLPEPPGGSWRDIIVRKIAPDTILITWTSQSIEARSWVFINGQFTIGPFFGETCERTITLRLPPGETFVVEVHDFCDDTVPKPVEQEPLVRPTIGWNGVENIVCYRVYHTIFDSPPAPPGGTMETLLCEVPPVSSRLEIHCPIRLEGKGGRWHSFRVESVDQFNNESENETVPHFAADLPPKPTLLITRDTASGLLNFRIR